MSSEEKRKNIMILVLSKYYFDRTGEYIDLSTLKKYILEDPARVMEAAQTNEAPVYDVVKCLEENGQKLDVIFCLTTKELTQSSEGNYYRRDKNEGKKKFTTQFDLWQQEVRTRCPKLNADGTKFIDIDIAGKDNAYEEHDIYEKNPHYDLVSVSQRQVAKVAARIKREMGNSDAWQDVHIYEDITGGYRYTSIMMTAIVQFLQYDGMKLEKVVYSDFERSRQVNKVFDFKDVDALYTLVSGLDAFAKFGDSKAMEQYFGCTTDDGGALVVPDRYTGELKTLLGNMRQFSDAVQLCQGGVFEQAIDDLQNALQAYQKRSNNTDDIDSREVVFAQLIDALVRGYADLWKRERDDKLDQRMRIIRWCAEKGFLQQAMTFGTEWSAEYLIKKRVLYPVGGIEEVAYNYSTKLRKKWEDNFLIDPDEIAKAYTEANARELKGIFLSYARAEDAENLDFAKPRWMRDGAVAKVKGIFLLIDWCRKKYRNYEGTSLIIGSKERESKDSAKYVMWAQKFVNQIEGKRALEAFLIDKRCMSKLKRFVDEWKADKMLLWFDHPDYKYQDPKGIAGLNWQESTDKVWGTAGEYWNKMYREWKIVGTEYTYEEMIECICSFFYLRSLRNKINHADEKEKISRKTVEEYLQNFLSAIDAVENKTKGAQVQ